MNCVENSKTEVFEIKDLKNMKKIEEEVKSKEAKKIADNENDLIVYKNEGIPGSYADI